MRKHLAVDLCNTLTDILGVLTETIGPNPNPFDYYHPLAPPEFFTSNLWIFRDALPIKGAREVIEHLAKRHKITYLTARPVESRDFTLNWLKKWGFPKREIIFTQDKPAAVASLNINGAIDDAPHEITALSRLIQVYVPAQTYNMGFPNRFTWTKIPPSHQVENRWLA